jgi:hypothetical protein
MSKRTFPMSGRVFHLLLTGLLLVYLIWGAAHLGGFQWDDDEGINVIKARLVEAGFRLYRDIWSDQPPLLTWILAATFRLVAPEVTPGRFVILLFATGGLLGIAQIAKGLAAPAAALLATLLLAVAPSYFTYARAIMVGLPAMALAALALAVAWDTPCRWRLLASGALFGASLLIKPITAYQVVVLAAVAALPCLRDPTVDWRSVLRQWGWLGVGGGIVVLPVVVVIGPDFVTQVVGTYAETKKAYSFSLMTNLSWTGHYLVENIGPFVLAIWGVVVWLRTQRTELGLMVLWLGLTLVALLTHTPLRTHQFLLLLFPTAILVAVGIEDLRQTFLAGPTLNRVLALVPALIALSWLVIALSADASLLIATNNDNDNWISIEIIRSAVAPDELVVTDAPMLAFRANRLVPSSLAVPSLRRLRTGGLTERFVIEQTAAAQPRAVVLWDGRFDLLPDYVEWVEQHYQLARSFNGGQKRIYLSVRDVQHPQDVNFGGEIRLLGYRLNTSRVEPGGRLYVTLYWRAIRRPTAIYSGFVHLLGPEGGLLSQCDLVTGTWSHLTVAWEPGEIVIEHYELEIPVDAPPGPWPLEVGLYEYQSRRRLPILDADDHPTESSSVLLSHQPVIRWPACTLFPQPDFSADAQFSQVARLLGYGLQPSLAAPGDTVQLILHWHALGSTPHSYTVFVHVLGPDGQLIAQADSPPCSGRCPTYGWVAGEYLADQRAFTLPADAPAGPCRIAVGLYDLVTGERLPAHDGQGHPLHENRVLLEGLEVDR